jgi:chromosome segregation ATPase
MSFSDMMSSGRGPGVIGMVLALIVLLGFGFLFMFASQESGPGRQSIESVIAQQAKEIDGYKANIEQENKQLALAPGRTATAKEINRLVRESKAAGERKEVLGATIDAAKTAIVAVQKQVEDYKDQYRQFVRSKAKGESMDELKTISGTVYKKVNIRDVTAIGIEIRHDEGHKRIPFEDLPEEMRDHFQFDPNQKRAAMAAESEMRGQHEAAAAAANVQAEKQMDAQRAQSAQADFEKAKLNIAAQENQIAALKSEITGLVAESARAAAEASAARSAGRVHINRAGGIDGTIRSKQNQIAGLQTELARMKAELSK